MKNISTEHGKITNFKIYHLFDKLLMSEINYVHFQIKFI